MATPANVIPVPKPARSAYNPNRPLGSNALIAAQLKHFEDAESKLAPELRTGIDVISIKTEGEASAYIRKVTEAIHKGGGRMRKVQSPR